MSDSTPSGPIAPPVHSGDLTNVVQRRESAEQLDRFPPVRQLKFGGVGYRFGHQVSFGSSSTIYKCVDEWGNQLVLKQYASTVPEALWHKEIRALQQFRGPQVVALHGYFQKDDVSYLILERFGVALSRLRDIPPAHRPRFVRLVLRAVLPALHQMHRQGWIFGDINPGNVLIDVGPDKLIRGVKLCDLALARPLDEKNVVPSVALWCPAPEQLNRDRTMTLQHSVDIYHAAALALQILEGEPLAFTLQEVMDGKVAERALQRDPQLGPSLAAALSVDPARRPDAIEFWRSLKLN